MADETRHPIIADTDALIAVANTSLWPIIRDTLTITTTNVCIQELKHHRRETPTYAAEGSRDHWLYNGSNTAIEPFEDDTTEAFSVVTCVPRPHGEDAGEESIRREIESNPGTYRFAILMDHAGREMLRRTFAAQEAPGQAVAPPFLLYLTMQAGASSREIFCEACAELLRGEGWTGYKAVQAAWEAIPVDCDDVIDDELLPE